MTKIKRASLIGAAFAVLLAGFFLLRSGFLSRFNSNKVRIDESRLYKVSYVVDGDTFIVNADGKEATVRLLGINTPETVDKRKPVECFGPEASAETKFLLKGREVKLSFNPNREANDKYGRFLLYAYRDDGLFVNEFLVKNGYAKEYTVGKPYSFQTQFRMDESEAKREWLGLWKACPD